MTATTTSKATAPAKNKPASQAAAKSKQLRAEQLLIINHVQESARYTSATAVSLAEGWYYEQDVEIANLPTQHEYDMAVRRFKNRLDTLVHGGYLTRRLEDRTWEGGSRAHVYGVSAKGVTAIDKAPLDVLSSSFMAPIQLRTAGITNAQARKMTPQLIAVAQAAVDQCLADLAAGGR